VPAGLQRSDLPAGIRQPVPFRQRMLQYPNCTGHAFTLTVGTCGGTRGGYAKWESRSTISCRSSHRRAGLNHQSWPGPPRSLRSPQHPRPPGGRWSGSRGPCFISRCVISIRHRRGTHRCRYGQQRCKVFQRWRVHRVDLWWRARRGGSDSMPGGIWGCKASGSAGQFPVALPRAGLPIFSPAGAAGPEPAAVRGSGECVTTTDDIRRLAVTITCI
jgi:hypothetical protein